MVTNSEFQFTPGGSRRREDVHMVSSTESAARNVTSHDPSSTTNSENATPLGDFVTPPGGRRHRGRIRRIRSGESFSFSQELGEGRLRLLDRPGPPDAANWITCAGWMNTTGATITEFTTTWTVPPPPATVGAQLIYLFNGIETADGKAIVQPVLQWGDSGADFDGQNRTGQFWTAASWLVGGADNSATHTPHVRVSPGDVLVGAIKLVGQSASGFTYTCEFEGLAGTMLPTPEMDELIWCVQTLEAYEGNQTPPYDLSASAEYPATGIVAFRSINIVTDRPNPVGSWISHDVVTTFGEHTTVNTNSSTDGEVLIYL